MNAHFVGEEPCVEFLPDGRNVRVVDHPITFIDSRGVVWIAPVGLETDGASIPSLLWPILGGPFEGEFRDGAILHDAAYQRASSSDTSFWSAERSSLRSAADSMLYEAARVRRTAWWRAQQIWQGVRLFGGFAWRDHARENARAAAGA